MRPVRPRGLAGAFRVALDGIARGARTQRNLRIQLVLGMAALALCLVVRLRPPYVAAIFGAIGLVLTAELLNTAIEAVVDLVTTAEHPLARDAKDLAAGAVLIASIVGLALGITAFGIGGLEGPQPEGPALALLRGLEAAGLLGLGCAAGTVARRSG